MRIECGAREAFAAVGVAAGVVVGALAVARLVRSRTQKARLLRARLLKTAQLQASVALWKRQALEKISEERSEAVVSLPFNELRDRLQSGQLTAVEVLHAYQRKAAVENEKYNFVCEPIAEAEELALACDRLADKHSKPLLGIPISVKENYKIKGYDSTFGFASRISQPSEASGASVQVMINQGAVPFIRTNIPQSMLAIDSHNPIYGYTVNPCDPKRSCGGSSGGEGAALACSASTAGLGSDISGSLRIPAAWCGVCSLKPTSLRTPWSSMASFCGGQNIVKTSSGPMARSVDGLVALSQALFSAEMHAHDPYMAHVPFAYETYSARRPLRIGYFISNGFIQESHSSARAVTEIRVALEKRGHELVPWMPPRPQWAAVNGLAGSIFGDGNETLVKYLKDEEVSPVLQDRFKLFSMPTWLRKLLIACKGAVLPEYMRQFLAACSGVGSVANWWKLQEEVDAYRKEAVASWQNAGLDAVICPAMPCPAMLLGQPSKAIGVVCYALIFNLLNFPAGVLPVTKVTKEDAAHDEQHYPAKDPWHRVIKESLKGSAGLPVAVQCATLPLQEELCLRLMKEVEECAAEGSNA